MAQNIRFMSNNLASLTLNEFIFSSEKVGFEADNALTDFRSETWKPTGHFEITSTNQDLFINDGVNKTVSITNGDFTTPDALATQIETDLNAASSGWTVVYDTGGETFKFTLVNSGSVTIRLSVTTNAIWDTIGYTGSIDRTGTSFEADEQRNHTDEFLRFDFGYQATVDFAAAIGDVASDFKVSTAANVTVEANNIDDFTAPPLSKALTVGSKGIFEFLDDDFDDTNFRFWRFTIEDKFNPEGPEGIEIGNLYLGDFRTTSRNVSVGVTFSDVDPSTLSETQAGVIFFDERTKYRTITNANIKFMTEDDQEEVEAVFATVGRTIGFYISIDPALCTTDQLQDLTRFVVFSADPSYPIVKNSTFSTVLNFRELV